MMGIFQVVENHHLTKTRDAIDKAQSTLSKFERVAAEDAKKAAEDAKKAAEDAQKAAEDAAAGAAGAGTGVGPSTTPPRAASPVDVGGEEETKVDPTALTPEGAIASTPGGPIAPTPGVTDTVLKLFSAEASPPARTAEDLARGSPPGPRPSPPPARGLPAVEGARGGVAASAGRAIVTNPLAIPRTPPKPRTEEEKEELVRKALRNRIQRRRKVPPPNASVTQAPGKK
jgi:hypothetical protein